MSSIGELGDGAVGGGSAQSDGAVLGCGAVVGVRWGVGLLLLVTAIAKAWDPHEAATLATAYHVPVELTAAVVQVELLAACLLLFAVAPRATLRATAAMFAAFACFSAYRGMAGYESCGCFGSVKVNPWITTLLDVGIVVASLWAARRSKMGAVQLGPLKGALGAYAVCGLAAAAMFVMSAPRTMADGGTGLQTTGGLVILEPEEWVGREFPLGDHLRPQVDVSSGGWTLLLYHHDCPDCQVALPKYERLAEQLAMAGDRSGVLLVEVPPYGGENLGGGNASYARLSDESEWFVQAPVEIVIKDGVVAGASLELPAVPGGGEGH